MTQLTSDSTTAATAVPLRSGSSSPMLDTAHGDGSHQRIHRFAGKVHQAIDSIEQRLSSRSAAATSTTARYGEQARHYGESLREQITARPLQSVGIALGTGAVLDKLFNRTPPKVRVVKVSVPARARWEPGPFVERRARPWTHAADAHVQSLRRAGHQTMGRLGAAAGAGLAGTQATVSHLTHRASTLPLQMRMATQRLLARSQEYGSLARSGVQAHPLIGLGAVLGASGLLTTLWMRRRAQAPATAYVAVDESGHGVAWQRDPYGAGPGARGLIASRPVTSAVVALGLGALLGAMLRRH